MVEQAQKLLQDKNAEAALDQVMECAQMNRLLQNGRGGTDVLLFTNKRIRFCMAQLPDILADSTLSAEKLKACAVRLDKLHFDKQALIDATKVQYALAAEMADRTAEQSRLFFDRNIPFVPFILKPNKVKRVYGEFTRQCLAGNSQYVHQNRASLIGIKGFLSGESFAALLLMRFNPDMSQQEGFAADQDALVDAARVLIALKLYKMQNGKLPEKLDALVPDFIAEIPKDTDEQPIRYLPGKKMVYLVGFNKNDDGGDPEDRNDDVFEIKF